jgi:hypothetical protein
MADGQPNPGTVLDIMLRDSSATGATAAFLPRAIPASYRRCGSAPRSTDDRRICPRHRTTWSRRRRQPASGNDAGAGRTKRPDRRWFPGADRPISAVSAAYAKQKPPKRQDKVCCAKIHGRHGHADRFYQGGRSWPIVTDDARRQNVGLLERKSLGHV